LFAYFGGSRAALDPICLHAAPKCLWSRQSGREQSHRSVDAQYSITYFRRILHQALKFRPRLVQKFSRFPSHQMFGHMHEALNVDEKKLIT
jgi:hypothetical protein